MPSDEVARLLKGALSGSLAADEPLSRHVTLRVGGPADLLARCDTIGDLVLVTEACARCGVPWSVLGRGSGIVAADSGYPGVAIVLAGEFRKHSITADKELVAGAGVQLALVVQEAFNRSLSGLECVAGVPGTLGGALMTDAGTQAARIGDVVTELTVYDPETGLATMGKSETGLPWDAAVASRSPGTVVVGARLALRHGVAAMTRGKMEGGLARRRKTQPVGAAACGPLFRDVAGGRRAADLIRGCGLAGLAWGGARISQASPNFVINTGSASAADVMQLVMTIRGRVREAYGIELEPAVRFLGFRKA